MKKAAHALIVVCLIVTLIQFIGYSARQGNMYSSVGAALGLLVRSDEAGFRKDVLRSARSLNFQLEQRDIRILQDFDTDRVDVQIKYRGKMPVLFFEIERETVIWQWTTDLGM